MSLAVKFRNLKCLGKNIILHSFWRTLIFPIGVISAKTRNEFQLSNPWASPMADICRAFSANALSKLRVCSKIYSLFKTSVSELVELSRSIRFAANSKIQEKTLKVTLRYLRKPL